MSRLLLLVESNTTGTGRQFPRACVRQGMVPVLITADPNRYPYVAHDRVLAVITDTSDTAAIVSTARRLAETTSVAGITSSSDYYVAAAAEAAAALGLPGADPAAMRTCRDKAAQRRRLATSGVPVPRFATAVSPAEAVSVAAGIGLPVVVKPVHGSGSVGVRLCRDTAEVARHTASVLTPTAGGGADRPAPAAVVEAFVPGREFSVEVFGSTPVTTVAKHVGPHPTFVETGHDLPADLPSADERALRATAARAVEALGLGWAAAHVELRMAESGPHVIEVNPRLAGGMIPELIRRAYGIDLIQAQIAAAVGRPVTLAPTRSAEASIRFLTATGGGVLAEVGAAVTAAASVDHVVDAAVYRSPGTPVDAPVDFRGRIGHVIAVSSRPGAAGAAADRGLDRLRTSIAYPSTADATVGTAA